jgi:3'-phosphoadenosine 5'-phosphosulfate sulfotransferase (PAPS reductase)/FAD synthetase
VVKQVQTTIRRFAMLTRGDTVGVAVSGGGDSVALLHCLVDLAEKFEVSLGVLHVNHGLRGDESDEDRNFVANLAAEMGLPFQSARLDAAEAARRAGDNLEQGPARALRHRRAGGGLGSVRLSHACQVSLESYNSLSAVVEMQYRLGDPWSGGSGMLSGDRVSS